MDCLANYQKEVINATLSSSGHQTSPVVFENINFEQRPYNKWASYGQSKTANILHAVELERRLGQCGVYAYAVHPGAIQTELLRHMNQAAWDMMRSRVDEGAKDQNDRRQNDQIDPIQQQNRMRGA